MEESTYLRLRGERAKWVSSFHMSQLCSSRFLSLKEKTIKKGANQCDNET